MTEQRAENKRTAVDARQLPGGAQSPHVSTGKVDDLYQDIVGRIVEACDPDKIILFGSRARGDHRPNSDVDILVIKESSEPRYKRDGPLYTAVATLPFEVDVLVYTPQEVSDWSGVRQALPSTAIREGIVIYERDT
jgi:predicted nucleotidyltransferase